MAQNAEIFFEHDSWPRALAWSAGFHVAVTALIVIYSVFFTGPSGQGWGTGGGGDAMGVTLVSSVPLPTTPAQTQNVLANESKGVTKSEPKVEEKEPDAIEIQGRTPRSNRRSLPPQPRPSLNPSPRKKPIRLPSAKVARSADPMAVSPPVVPRAASALPAAVATSAPNMAGTFKSSSGKFPRIG